MSMEVFISILILMLVFVAIGSMIRVSERAVRQDVSLKEWCENFCKPNNYNETSCKVGCLGIRESEATK